MVRCWSHDPHLMTVGTQRMSCCAEVNGAAMEASASDREIPAIAAFKACPQRKTHLKHCHSLLHYTVPHNTPSLHPLTPPPHSAHSPHPLTPPTPSTYSPHPLTPPTHPTHSLHPLTPPTRPTLSPHPLTPPTHSTHSPTHSLHPLTPPTPPIHSSHPLTPSTHPAHSLHPLTPPTHLTPSLHPLTLPTHPTVVGSITTHGHIVPAQEVEYSDPTHYSCQCVPTHPMPCSLSTNCCFCGGDIRANTVPFTRSCTRYTSDNQSPVGPTSL